MASSHDVRIIPESNRQTKIVLHLDSLAGTTIATLTTTSTGSGYWFAPQSTSIAKVTGVHNLYVQFVGTTAICNLLSFTFA